MRPDGRSPLARSLSGFAPHALLCALVFAALPRTGAAQDLGVWDPPVAWPMVAVHLLHQPDGEILSWAYNGTSARLWNPDTGAFTAVPTAHNIFCSGHAAIAKDGRYVVAGGICLDCWTQLQLRIKHRCLAETRLTCWTLRLLPLGAEMRFA